MAKTRAAPRCPRQRRRKEAMRGARGALDEYDSFSIPLPDPLPDPLLLPITRAGFELALLKCRRLPGAGGTYDHFADRPCQEKPERFGRAFRAAVKIGKAIRAGSRRMEPAYPDSYRVNRQPAAYEHRVFAYARGPSPARSQSDRYPFS